MNQAMQSVADLSAFVMMADGREDPSEWESLKTLSNHQGFDWEAFKKAVEESVKEQTERGAIPEHPAPASQSCQDSYVSKGGPLGGEGG